MRSCSWNMMKTPWMPMMIWSRAMAGWCAGSRMASCGAGSDAGKSRSGTTATSQTTPSTQSIVETALASGFFSRLVEAVKATGLLSTLEGAGPFTVFAPTDEAFSKIPADTLDALLQDPDRLKSILTYHVVPGRISAADLGAIDSLRTVRGAPLRVDTRLGVRVGSAYVIEADIPAANGVIHAIDSVLSPESD